MPLRTGPTTERTTVTRIRDFVTTAIDLTKCWLCGDPAITTKRSLLGFKAGFCALHTELTAA